MLFLAAVPASSTPLLRVGLPLLLAIVSSGAAALGFQAHVRARLDVVEAELLHRARLYAHALRERPDRPGVLDELATRWAGTHAAAEECLMVVDGAGRVTYHPLQPAAVGSDVSGNRVEGELTLGRLLERGEEHVGTHRTRQGAPQLAALVPLSSGAVVVFRPRAATTAAVRARALADGWPWLLLAGVLVPGGLVALAIGRSRAARAGASRMAALEDRLGVLDDRVAERTSRLESANRALQGRDASLNETRRALEVSEERYRSMFDRNRAVKLLIDPDDGRIVDANLAACEFYGWSRGEMRSMSISDINTLPPDEVRVELERARTESKTRFEFRHRLANGEVRDVEVHTAPVDGLLYSIITDVTSRKRAEKRQELMVRELDHRVKNVLATVQSIADQTRRTTPDSTAFAEAFRGRLAALSRVHDALSQAGWRGAGLRDLVARATGPYDGQGAGRVHVEGPDLELPSHAVLPITMALHELSTNAAKYGALSVPEGRVEVSCAHRAATDGRGQISLSWRERSGPHVELPQRRGFGTTLIERGVAYELGGEVSLDFDPAGVICTIDFTV